MVGAEWPELAMVAGTRGAPLISTTSACDMRSMFGHGLHSLILDAPARMLVAANLLQIPLPKTEEAMKGFITTSLLVACMFLPVRGQAQDGRQVRIPESDPETEVSTDAPVYVNGTAILDRMPETRQAVEDFHARRAAGLLQRGLAPYGVLGDTAVFKVYNFVDEQLEDIQFELKVRDSSAAPRFQIWVESAELNSGRVREGTLDTLYRALGERTPPGSFNPNAGIIENDEVIFGEPPDVDGDGVTDILVLDIRDGWDGVTKLSAISGFVNSFDLGSRGNNRDILYLDTHPTLRVSERMQQTAAHEYQHLIALNWDPEEISFIDEGLSEWAEIALGYPSRVITYLGAEDRYNVSLYRWNRDDPFDDYQRAGMFISYIADRWGALEAGKITRSTASGTSGLRDALVNIRAGITLEQLIADFHAATYFNDASVDPRFAFSSVVRQGVRAVPGVSTDGRTISETLEARAEIKPGAAQFLLWESVEDFSLTLTPLSSDENPDLNSDSLRARMAVFGTDGTPMEVTDLVLDGNPVTVAGKVGRVSVVLVNVNPDGGQSGIDYEAAWAEPQTETTFVLTRYDTGQTVSGTLFNLSAAADGVTATRFVTPAPDQTTQIDRVYLAPYFLNQFASANLGASEPRDFVLQVRGPSGRNEPGDVIFSKEMVDPRAYAPPQLDLNHFEIDMAPYAQEIGMLPDTIYVGIGEAGTDQNYQVIGGSPYDVEDVSWVGRQSSGNWRSFWSVQFTDPSAPPDPLKDLVIPTRVRFSVTTVTAIEDGQDIPRKIALHQNFPNPFNPTTTIGYHLPSTEMVRLQVHDLLGRRVAVLVDGIEPPGEHLVTLDARQWASGVYIYTLETDNVRHTRRMLLLK